jgi:hypothetical protein
MSDIYLNNPLLKKSDTKLSYTPEQVDEFVRCYKDIIYFFTNYVYIVNLDEGRMLFRPYDYQIDMVKTFHENRFSIAMLSRQMGKCCHKNINIRVRNKKTGDVYDMPIGEFYQQRRIERDMQESDCKN